MNIIFWIINILFCVYEYGVESKLLPSLLRDLIQFPLKGKEIVVFIDESVIYKDNKEYVLEKDILDREFLEIFEDFSVYTLYSTSFLTYMNSVLSLNFLNPEMVLIIISNKDLSWLNDDFSPKWIFNTVILININKSESSESYLSTKFMKMPVNVALLELVNLRGVNRYGVFSLLPFHKNRGKRMNKFLGFWNTTNFNTFESLFPNRYKSFNGEIIHLASDIDDFPFVYMENAQLKGISINALKIIGEKLNFSFTFTKDGEWKDLLQQIFIGEKDITVNSLLFTLDRMIDFDYSVSYFYEGSGFVLKKPEALPMWSNLFYPLSITVWSATIITVMVFPLLYYLIIKYSDNFHLGIPQAYMDIIKSLLRQALNWDAIPESGIGKLSLVFFWFGAIVLISSYTGNLVAFLTIPKFPKRITTIEGLAKSDTKLVMIDYGGFVEEKLKSSSDPTVRKLGQSIIFIPWVKNGKLYKTAIENYLKTGKYSLLETYSYLK
ncbi:UNVERIFIED_CONTAM: hypothetical protein RMT77_005661 [Armadillidium vulgare]